MEEVRIYCENTEAYHTVTMGSTLKELARNVCQEDRNRILAALVDNKLTSLDYRLASPPHPHESAGRFTPIFKRASQDFPRVAQSCTQTRCAHLRGVLLLLAVLSPSGDFGCGPATAGCRGGVSPCGGEGVGAMRAPTKCAFVLRSCTCARNFGIVFVF